MRVKLQNVLILLGMLIVWNTILSGFALYRSRRFTGLRAELVDVLKATLTMTLVIGTVGMLLRIRVVSPRFCVTFFAASFALMMTSRVIIRLALYLIRRRGRNLRSLLIAGTNDRAIAFARKVEKRPDLGYSISGFVDQEWPGSAVLEGSRYRVVCTPDAIGGYLTSNVLDEMVIALPPSQYSSAAYLAAACEQQGITIRYLAFTPKTTPVTTENFDGDLLIRHTSTAIEGWSALTKRSLDFVLALLVVVMLSPVFCVVAVLIALSSKGPVLFSQERVGLNKRSFRMYKFRTMVADAEARLAQVEHLNEVSGPVFKIKRDPRITPIGRFLRRTSLDELPQLFNVLKGDMSLVGPRPLPFRDYAGFSEDWQRRRFSVLPGITCLWQINGRSSIAFEEWMRLDLQYVDRWSLWLDLKILFKTVPAVLRGYGAA